MSSATASNLSTGNWTFSQTVLDCLQGAAYADNNDDNWIDVNELQHEIEAAMQYRERQKSGFASFKWDSNSKIAPVATSTQYKHLYDCYKWAPYKNSWSCVRILKKDAKESLCEFYFYADKVQKVLSNDALRPMHFVRHQKGTKVQVEWKNRWYPATILQAEGDFAYIKYDNYDNSWNEWVLYDRIRKGTEQKVQVWDGNAYYPALILEKAHDLYYIHYINIGGFSSGGNLSLLLTNHLIESQSDIQPKGVFAIDAPVDLLELYRLSERNIHRQFSQNMVAEAQWLKNRLQTSLGKPDSSVALYAKHAVYTHETNNCDNLRALNGLKIRFYAEPDSMWWKNNRNNDSKDLNAYWIEQLYKALTSILKDATIEFIKTEQKGYRSDGQRHPHSWSIVDKEELFEWLEND